MVKVEEAEKSERQGRGIEAKCQSCGHEFETVLMCPKCDEEMKDIQFKAEKPEPS